MPGKFQIFDHCRIVRGYKTIGNALLKDCFDPWCKSLPFHNGIGQYIVFANQFFVCDMNVVTQCLVHPDQSPVGIADEE